VLVTQTSNTGYKSAGNYSKKLFSVYIFLCENVAVRGLNIEQREGADSAFKFITSWNDNLVRGEG
jgi:hypothetical protein